MALTNQRKVTASTESAARSRKHNDANRSIFCEAAKGIIQGGDEFRVQRVQPVRTVQNQSGDAILLRFQKDRSGLRRLRRMAHKASRLVCPDFPGFFNLGHKSCELAEMH